jgi:diacylglycerol kinase family enzyme
LKAAIFINNSSGSNVGKDGIQIIRDSFNSKTIDTDVIEVMPHELRESVKNALNKKVYDIIIAAGGDGTVSSIASVLTGTGIPMGILPLGTLNHFARDLRIPFDTEPAIEIISKLNTADIDIAEVNGHHFVNNSSIGIYPHMVKKRDVYKEMLGTGKWISLILAFFKIFRLFPLYTIEITEKKTIHKMRSPFVFIGNNDYTMSLYELGERKEISKGHLTLYYAKCKSRLCILKLAVLTIFNLIDQSENFVMSYNETFKINSRKNTVSVSVDGEVKRMELPLVYKIHKKSLKVIVPDK